MAMTARRYLLIDVIEMGLKNSVRELIAKGYDVNEQSYGGCTAVMMCVHRNDDEILQMLIDAGAEVDIVDGLGRSPLSQAKRLKHDNVVQIIEKTLKDRLTGRTSAFEAANRGSNPRP